MTDNYIREAGEALADFYLERPPSPKADCLYHFTSLASAKAILAGTITFWPSYSLEDMGLFEGHPLYALRMTPMVSFCDIPVSSASFHAAQYGEIGIGIEKNWALRNGLSPVQYVVADTWLHSDLKNLFEELAKQDPYVTSFLGILSHIKPYKGRIWDKSSREINREWFNVDFYRECEWRFVPKGMKFHFHSPFTTKEWQDLNDQDIAARMQHQLVVPDESCVRVLVPEGSLSELRRHLHEKESGLAAKVEIY